MCMWEQEKERHILFSYHIACISIKEKGLLVIKKSSLTPCACLNQLKDKRIFFSSAMTDNDDHRLSR